MTAKLSVRYAHATDIGRKSENQDCHGAVIPDGQLLETKGVVVALADGVSSSDAGRQASEASISGFLNDYYSTPDSWLIKTAAGKVLNSINRWLYGQSQSVISQAHSHATTFSAIVLKSNTAHLFHIGDTRIYLLRAQQFEQLTRDHRVMLSESEHYLSRALGIESHIDIDYRTVTLEAGDTFLLTTDGVHDVLDHRTIENLVRSNHHDLQQAVTQLIKHSLEANSQDNITCQLIHIDSLPDANNEEFYQVLTRLPFPPDLCAGYIIDGFRILREIHASKRSQCYLALDTESNQQVVLKTPSVNFEDDPLYIKLFLQEEWIGKRINDPNVVKVLEQGQRRKFLYQITEYVDSKTLRQWLHDNPRPSLDQIRVIAGQIAKGLRAFHRLEIIHRDLKPENIIIDTFNCAKIIDFGSARIAGDEELMIPLKDMPLLGTVDYSAPEFLLGAHGNEKSDQFSLAVMVYEMITTALPFGEPLNVNTPKHRRYIPISERGAALAPYWMDAALKQALHADPEKRYDDIAEFIYDLSHPNSRFRAPDQMPFIERQPLKFWKGLSLILFIVNIILAGLVLIR